MITGKKIYMLGIKGVGMTALALLYHRAGNTVIGSDVATHFITDPVLHTYGINVYEGFDAAHVSTDIDLVVVSGAHANASNPEYAGVLERKLPIQTHAEALGELMYSFETRISVCGSHGKTTTSAMLATIFSKTHKKGAHHIGVPHFSGLDGGMYSGTDYIIVEADEYATIPHVNNAPRFSFQKPTILACTNVDFDHPDIYKDLEDVQAVFTQFMQRTLENGGKVVCCGDDPGLLQVIAKLPKENLYSYGTLETNDLNVHSIQDDAESTTFQCSFRGDDLGTFSLEVPGQHNILNAACAVLVSHLAKIETPIIHDGLSKFTGSSRRFQLIARNNNAYVYDDYAHHPKEISAVIQAARHKFPQHRMVIIFQPHTFSRTNAMAKEFRQALDMADEYFILNVFTSEREKDASLLATELGTLYNADDLMALLSSKKVQDTIIITMGAGDVYTLHPALMKLIETPS